MGVDIETMKEGDAQTFPKSGQKVTCHYTLTLTNGKKIDSSRDRGEPFAFKIGKGEVSRVCIVHVSNCRFASRIRCAFQVIAGWEQGLAKMSVGQRAKLTISPDMGYGAKGVPGTIPPNATLVFDVELLKVN